MKNTLPSAEQIKIDWQTPVSEDAQKQAERVEQLVAFAQTARCGSFSARRKPVRALIRR